MKRFGVVGLFVLASAARAQQVRVLVRDDVGAPVGYALVAPIGSASFSIATDSGVATVRVRSSDSLNLSVRRIGHRAHVGWVKRDSSGGFVVSLSRLVTSLSAVQVTAAGSPSNNPLAQRGFYDRFDRVQKGAIVGDLFTPELLDERPGFTKITQMIAGSRYARVQSMPLDSERGSLRVLVIVGRGGCPMSILLDGQLVKGTAQDFAISEVPQSIAVRGTQANDRRNSMDAKVSIDEVVDGRSVMAIEVYPSTGNAPAELVRVEGRGSCGIVALWTGSRR